MSLRRSFSLSRKKKPEPKPKPFQISSDLAMKIIEKELELEKTWNSSVIHELMALYSQAIEYYEQQGNPRYYDFQDRMHKMLIKPQVISVLQRLNCPEASTSESPSVISSNPIQSTPEEAPKQEVLVQTVHDSPMTQRKFQAEQTRKQFSIEFNKSLSKHKTQRNFNIIIDRHSSSSKETALKATADFKSQDSALQRRLASRQKSQLTKSMTFLSYSSNDLSRVFGCDLSDVDEELNTSTKSSFFAVDDQTSDICERFEKRLEEIMEKSFSERSCKIAEIKFRYESQINEITGMGDMMDILVKQMRVNMQEEIDFLVQEYDLKRKEEIRALKEEMSTS